VIKKLFLLFLLPFISFLFISCAGSLSDQGRSSLSEQNYEKAVILFKQAIQADEKNKDAWRGLGIAQYKLNQFTDAEVSLLKAYNLVKDGETIFYLGLVYESLEEYDKAINYYKEYSTISVDNDIAQMIEGRITFISRKKMEQEVKFAIDNEDKISKEPVPENTVAVLYFQNLGDKKELDPLQKGLAEMLITDLSKVKDLKVVERVKLQKLLDELKLGTTPSIDQTSAPRIGKLMRASKLVKGSFLNLEEDKFRVDANFIETQDGSYKPVKNVSGTLTDYFKLQKELVFNIVADLGIQLTDTEREAIQVIPTESFLSFVAYSKGLDLEDRGMYSDALQQYKEAATLDPGFKEAGNKVNEIQTSQQKTSDFESTRNSMTNVMAPAALDRLIDSNTNLTNEVISGQDDHNPNATQGFGRGVKVNIEVKVR
jgi:tetratricopeptide (TPR) repeat protein